MERTSTYTVRNYLWAQELILRISASENKNGVIEWSEQYGTKDPLKMTRQDPTNAMQFKWHINTSNKQPEQLATGTEEQTPTGNA